MDEQIFQTKFNELMSRIQSLPDTDREQLERMAEETRVRRERLTNSIGELQESLDHLRLTVKYLIFDLEATRRENAYLRKMLEQANRNANQKRQTDQREYLDEDGGDE